MKYDLKQHIWVLEEQDVLDKLGYSLTEQLDDVNKVDIFLEETSHDVYDYIYKNSIELNHDRVTYLFRTDEFSYLMEQALFAQVRYALRSRGAHLIKDNTGINMDAMVILEDEFYERVLGPQTKTILARSGLIKEVPIRSIPPNIVKGVDY